MAKSNKPLLWLPFAAGGTVAAFLLPAVMGVMLLASFDLLPEHAIAFERLRASTGHALVKPVIFLLLGLPLWHAAHRLRMTLQDLGVRVSWGRRLAARLCYSAAAAVTLVLLYSLG